MTLRFGTGRRFGARNCVAGVKDDHLEQSGCRIWEEIDHRLRTRSEMKLWGIVSLLRWLV